MNPILLLVDLKNSTTTLLNFQQSNIHSKVTWYTRSSVHWSFGKMKKPWTILIVESWGRVWFFYAAYEEFPHRICHQYICFITHCIKDQVEPMSFSCWSIESYIITKLLNFQQHDTHSKGRGFTNFWSIGILEHEDQWNFRTWISTWTVPIVELWSGEWSFWWCIRGNPSYLQCDISYTHKYIDINMRQSLILHISWEKYVWRGAKCSSSHPKDPLSISWFDNQNHSNYSSCF